MHSTLEHYLVKHSDVFTDVAGKILSKKKGYSSTLGSSLRGGLVGALAGGAAGAGTMRAARAGAFGERAKQTSPKITLINGLDEWFGSKVRKEQGRKNRVLTEEEIEDLGTKVLPGKLINGFGNLVDKTSPGSAGRRALLAVDNYAIPAIAGAIPGSIIGAAASAARRHVKNRTAAEQLARKLRVGTYAAGTGLAGLGGLAAYKKSKD